MSHLHKDDSASLLILNIQKPTIYYELKEALYQDPKHWLDTLSL